MKELITGFMFTIILFSSISRIYAQNDMRHPAQWSDASQRCLERIRDQMERWEIVNGALVFAAVTTAASNSTGPEEFVKDRLGIPDGDLELQETINSMGAVDIIERRAIIDMITLHIAQNNMEGEELDFWMNYLGILERIQAAAVNGHSTGDPHIVTLDDFHYDFQTVGEYILCKSTKIKGFEVQTRQTAIGNSLSVNSAVALNVHGDRICIYLESPDKEENNWLWVNHHPFNTKNQTLFNLTNGGSFSILKNKSILVTWITGEKVNIDANSNHINIAVNVPISSIHRYEGLLGNANGIKEDDLKIKGQGNIWIKQEVAHQIADVSNNVLISQAEILFNKKLTQDFSNSWLVSDSTSLFDYATGMGTKDFVNKKFPSEFLSINSLTADQLANAQSICEKAGVESKSMRGCIFDVAFSQNNTFATSAAMVDDVIILLNKTNIFDKTILSRQQMKAKLKNEVTQKAKKILKNVIRN